MLALEPRRTDRNKMLDTLQSITVNENVQQWDYEPKDGGDELLVNSSLVPIEMQGRYSTNGRQSMNKTERMRYARAILLAQDKIALVFFAKLEPS